MKLTDEALRQLIADRSADSSAQALDLDLLVSVARDQLDTNQRQLLVETMADNSAAVAEYQLAKSIGAKLTEQPHDEVTERMAAPVGFRARTQWGIAASLLLAVGVVGWLSLPLPAPDTTRGVTAVTSPADGAELRKPPTSLRWPGQRGVEHYRVEIVLASSGQPVWRSEPLTTTTVQLPNDVVTQIQSGQLYQWRVIAGLDSNMLDTNWRTFTVN